MAVLLCLTALTIVYRYLSETCVLQLMISIKALSLADDEEKKFNHRRTNYCYVRNTIVEKGDRYYFCECYIETYEEK